MFLKNNVGGKIEPIDTDEEWLYLEYGYNSIKVFTDINDSLSERKTELSIGGKTVEIVQNGMPQPVKEETNEEYSERVIKTYEEKIAKYKELLEKDEQRTIEYVKDFTRKYIDVLSQIKE